MKIPKDWKNTQNNVKAWKIRCTPYRAIKSILKERKHLQRYTWYNWALSSTPIFVTRSTFLLCPCPLLTAVQPFLALCQGFSERCVPPGYCPQSTYSEVLLLLWLRGSVGRLESRTWIPSELIARIKIVTIASTGSFSRTITRQRLRRAALTWKEGFSVVAPIRVIVPHSTWGRKVS